MDKITLLNEVKAAAAQGLLGRDEVLAAFQAGAPADKHHVTLSKVLYYLGGTIIIVGIVVLLGQNWSSLSVPIRILVTLGSGAAAYVMGILFSRYENLEDVGQAFYFISGMVLPVGLGVLLDSQGFNLNSNSVQLYAALALFAVFLGSFFLLGRRIVFMIFSLIFGTYLFHTLIRLIIGDAPLFNDLSKVWEYETLVVGVCYLLFGA